MPHVYSLAYLTSAPLHAAESITLAAALGYQAVGIRILPVGPGGDYTPLIEQPALLRETIARSKATGVSVFDVEIIRLTETFSVAAHDAFLDTCAALGAKAILVACDDANESRLTASYAAFCEAAHKRRLTCDIEFMPWTRVPDCRTALRVVTAAAQPNGGILVDALHAARSSTTLADIAAIPRHMLHYAQICDAPAEVPTTNEGLIHTARNARLLPGSGGIDLKAMFAALPADLPTSIEIPHAEHKARLGVEEWSRQALATTKTLIAR